uniref:Beta-glucosidase n=1 Tax=Opuntia streptacantha TaxID=393608 RepID=A0A7C8ZNK5_OPUST
MKCMLPATAATTITIFFFLSSHFFVVSSCIHHLKTTAEDDGDDEISSSTSELRFPSNFLFGAASSAYQYEGAYLSDGKGLNNWDTYTHISGKIIDGSTGDVATDHYHRYLEDVKLMTDLGLNGYRFSISWARILPKGRYGGINIAGITFYTKLINALLLEGIQPFVTMSHFDIPQELQDRYGGWLSPQLKEDFAYYAEVCFKYFGKWVKHWVTFNEPNSIAALGYRYGQYPPGRCSASFGNCSQGDSDREPFIVAHNLILAHAAAVNLYRTKYQEKQGGVIGIVVHAIWFEPMSNSSADKIAVERAQSFYMNWFLDPIMFGEYPPEMRRILGPNLPKFTLKEQKILNKALDFIGINHYTSLYVKDCMLSMCEPGLGTSWSEDSIGLAICLSTRNGEDINLCEGQIQQYSHVHHRKWICTRKQ